MKFTLAISLCLLLLMGATAYAQDDPLFFKPMTFVVYDEHSGNSSRRYILARGEITPNTPSEFLSFYRRLPADDLPAEVWFHSPGGSLAAGLKLGRLIRQLRLSTMVGGEYTRFPGTITVVKAGYCFSACAWAFLGGRVRVVTEDYAFGVHQFKTGENQGTEAGAQVTMATLAAYLDEMRVNRKVLDLAAATAADDIAYLSANDAHALNVDNAEQSIGRWEIKAAESGMIMGHLVQKLPRTDDTASVLLLSDFFRGSLILSVNYTVKHSMRGQEDIQRTFGAIDRTPLIHPGPRFESFESIPTSPTTETKWRNIGKDTYQILVPIAVRNLRTLCRQQYFTIDPDWPHCCMDLAPAMTVPTKGLLPIVAALEKQGPVKMPPRR